jgi:hypothetical protein
MKINETFVCLNIFSDNRLKLVSEKSCFQKIFRTLFRVSDGFQNFSFFRYKINFFSIKKSKRRYFLSIQNRISDFNAAFESGPKNIQKLIVHTWA